MTMMRKNMPVYCVPHIVADHITSDEARNVDIAKADVKQQARHAPVMISQRRSALRSCLASSIDTYSSAADVEPTTRKPSATTGSVASMSCTYAVSRSFSGSCAVAASALEPPGCRGNCGGSLPDLHTEHCACAGVLTLVTSTRVGGYNLCEFSMYDLALQSVGYIRT